MLVLLLQLVIVALVLGLICWVVTQVPMLGPFAQIIRVVCVVIFVIYVIYLLMGLLGGVHTHL